MSSHQEEKMYTAADMQLALAAVEKFKKEAEQSHQLLWAVIHEAGGEIAVPHRLWIEVDKTREIIMWDDPVEYRMHLKAKRE
jgi:hypothetical protein